MSNTVELLLPIDTTAHTERLAEHRPCCTRFFRLLLQKIGHSVSEYKEIIDTNKFLGYGFILSTMIQFHATLRRGTNTHS